MRNLFIWLSLSFGLVCARPMPVNRTVVMTMTRVRLSVAWANLVNHKTVF
jgi:hypothetical protein